MCSSKCSILQSYRRYCSPNYIRINVGETIFHRIYIEVVVDSDQVNLNKIQRFISENQFSQEEKETLLRNIKQVLFADGSVDFFEKETFSILKKMIN